MKYAIQAEYYYEEKWNPMADEEGVVTKPMYVGLSGRIFIFEHTVTRDTKLFENAKEAGEYLDKHFGKMQRASFKTLRIVEVNL